MEILINFIKEIHPLPQETFQKLFGLLKVNSHKAGNHLSELGVVNNKFFFVLDGITRTYMKHEPDGQEINKSITPPGNLATSLKSAMNNEPARIACQCLTDSLIVEANIDDLAKLRAEDPVFCEFMYKAVEREYAKLEESIIDLLSKNATERYLQLRENIKNIDQLIPQFQIASHLGITPIQLSRIRKKLLMNSRKK